MGLFKKATKEAAKLRLAIAGPSGSGKTYSALAIATELGGPVAVVDTEHGSASKYADIFDFDVAEMHAPYHPDKYVAAIKEAAAAGYGVLILDSMTHAWNGEGGILELVEQATKRQKTPNSYTAWADVTPIQNRLIETIVSANIHIIATMRSKQEYVQRKDERTGRTVIDKVGMAPIQREGFEYEFDIFFDMDVDNNAVVSKTRCPELTGKVIAKPGAQVARVLAKWLGKTPQNAPERTFEASTVDSAYVAQIAPQNAVIAATEEANPFDDTQEPTAEELALIAQWSSRSDAENWAIMVGACANDFEAKNSLNKSVNKHGGKVTKGNLTAIYTDFIRHQYEKLQQQPVAEVA